MIDRDIRLISIVSGGQTGADRAALDWALAHRVPCGGWCPRGRRAEDGRLHPRYPLTETPSCDYSQRTDWNVRDSDATVIFTLSGRLSGGSLVTRERALRWRRPWLHLHPGVDAPALLRAFLDAHRPRVLNVAGPRASKEPRVGVFVRSVLDQAAAPFAASRPGVAPAGSARRMRPAPAKE
jgi:hypothetical protein